MDRMKVWGEDPEYTCFVQGAAITKAVYRALQRLEIKDIADDVCRTILGVVQLDISYDTPQADIQDDVDSEINEMFEIGETIVIDGVLVFNPANEMTDEELNYDTGEV